ncbi:hypothetical protein, partial [Enterococcus cecorum]|uniref:hypothetical protein n=1 Tax=Enterococcus cecorum TaxID=44008 RepID=UPI003F522F3C
ITHKVNNERSDYLYTHFLLETNGSAPTGVPPLHGSHVAILIACDGFITLGLLTVWEYHYHDKNVVAGNPAKDCFSDH